MRQLPVANRVHLKNVCFFFNKVKKRKLLYRKKKKNDFLRKAELRQESEIRKRGLLCHIK